MIYNSRKKLDDNVKKDDDDCHNLKFTKFKVNAMDQFG